jgi:hypothetical protein
VPTFVQRFQYTVLIVSRMVTAVPSHVRGRRKKWFLSRFVASS